jgi:hypothetical protein
MKILGYEIKRATNYAVPPAQQQVGAFVIRQETTQIIPATIEQFTASLNAARSSYTQERGYLYDMYQNALDFDAQLVALWQKRIISTSGLRLEYVVGDTAVDASNVVDSPRFAEFIGDYLMSLRFWGMGLFEFRDELWKGRPLFDYYAIPVKHIDPYTKTVRVRQYTASHGDKSWKNMRNVVFVGKPDEFGLGLQATLLALYKRETMNRYANYIRLAGNNFERVKYRGAIPDPMRRADIIDRLQRRQTNTVDLPPDIDVEFDNLTSSQQNELFENALKYYNDQLSLLVLGQTMTTQDGSSRSQAEVHERVQDTIFDADAKAVLDMLNFEMYELMPMWGLPLGGRWRFVERASSRIRQMAELDKMLKDIGVIWTDAELRQRYNL